MKFKRINTDTVRCLISEEELNENGLELDDFLNNKGKTEDFVRRIISMAEQEVDYKVQGGPVSVQVAVLDNRTLALTLSEKQEQNIMEMIKNLRSAVEVLKEVTDQNADTAKQSEPAQEKAGKSIEELINESGRLDRDVYELEFASLDHFMRYCSSVDLDVPVENSLYKLKSNGRFYLLLCKEPLTDPELCKLLGASLDFAEAIYSDGRMKAYLEEHGQLILRRQAMQQIRELDEAEDKA